MAPKAMQRFYWCACAWIGFINREAKKIHPLQSIWSDAEAGKCELWTSTYSYLEVIKGALQRGEVHHAEENDSKVDNILVQPWVKLVQLDSDVAKLARKLRRDLANIRIELGLQEPLPRPDAIHLATAALYDCDELHTWDAAHLICYDGKVRCSNGAFLRIRAPGPEVDGPLFATIEDEAAALEEQAALDKGRQKLLRLLSLRENQLLEQSELEAIVANEMQND